MQKIEMKFFWGILWKQRLRWAQVLLLGAAGSILGLVNPYLAKLVVDTGLAQRDLERFVILGLIGAGVFVISELLAAAKKILERLLKAHVHFQLNKKLFACFQRLPYQWFSARSSGEQLYKINYDTTATVDLLTDTFPQAVFVFFESVLIFGVIFWLDWQLGLCMLCAGPILFIPTNFFTRKIQSIYESLIFNTERILEYLQEMFSHMLVIKIFGTEKKHARAYLSAFIRGIRLDVRNARVEIAASFTMELVTKAILALIGFYGGYQVIQGRLSLGSLTAIAVYLYRLVNLEGQVSFLVENFSTGMVSLRRLKAVFEESQPFRVAQPSVAAVFKHADIQFRAVSFGYASGEPVLNKVSLMVEGGSCVSIVGRSGCGKTTLLNLLVRLYEPWEGVITIDELALPLLDSACLKQQIGFVTQEPFLWNDTIENNIRYARSDASQAEVERVVLLVGLEGFVASLAGGLKTVVGENACMVSEGQKQRIAIARALIKQPKILILDEALSSIDPESEAKIIANIRREFPVLTILITSHRLSTVMRADIAYFFDAAGRMSADTPHNLFERNQAYRDLFNGKAKP